MGAFHLRRLAANIASKLGNAYLRYQNRQPATRFPLTATLAMLAILVLPVRRKVLFDSAPSPFVQGRIFIVPHQRFYGASIYEVLSEGSSESLLVAFFEKQKGTEDLCSNLILSGIIITSFSMHKMHVQL